MHVHGSTGRDEDVGRCFRLARGLSLAVRMAAAEGNALVGAPPWAQQMVQQLNAQIANLTEVVAALDGRVVRGFAELRFECVSEMSKEAPPNLCLINVCPLHVMIDRRLGHPRII